MALPKHPYMSVKDYLVLDKNSIDARYEYLDGELHMLAGGSIFHSLIAASIGGILYSLLRGSSCRVFNSDIRLQLSESRYVYPDITVSCDARDLVQGSNIHYPILVVEVLSPGTESIDRIKKLRYYLETPTVQEYILIDSQRVLVEMYSREGKRWVLQGFGLEDEIELKSLSIKFAIADLYEGIEFGTDGFLEDL